MWRGIHFSRALSVVAMAALFAAGAVNRSVAQDTQRADIARSQTEIQPGASTGGVVDGHIAPSPNDSDLGEQEILKRSDAYQPFTATASLPGFYTSNASLARSNEPSDFILAPSAGLFYQPRFSNTFYGLADVREQLFYYDRFDQLNFGDFDVDLGLQWIFPQMENLVLRIEYNYDRLTDKDSFHAFFQNHAIIVNAEAPVRLGRAQQLSFGATANVSVTAEPESPRRNDYEAYIAYTLLVTRDFSVNAVGRLILRDYYHQDSRVDVSENVALTATYQFNQYFAASGIGTFAANQSNHSVFDYKVGNAGGALSLAIKF
jgi:hypothetical protein